MEDSEKEFIKRVNLDKAKNKTIVPIILMVISILTYIPYLIIGEFDFGIIFEIASMVLLIVARIYMSNYDESRAKRYLTCSIVSIVWILIYDLITVFSSAQDVVDLVFFSYMYYFGEIVLIVYLISLFAINRILSKADNPEKYKESTDWFYEKYEDKKE